MNSADQVSRKIVREMMVDRKGEFVAEDEETMLWSIPVRGGQRTRVLVIWKENVGNDDILDVNQRCGSIGCTHAILVRAGKITPHAVTMIAGLKSLPTPVVIEDFEEATLRYNPTKHVLVPRHVPCGPQKKRKVMEQYAVGPKGLPILLSSDPIARWYGFVKGQLIEIHRPRPDGGHDLTYRIVA